VSRTASREPREPRAVDRPHLACPQAARLCVPAGPARSGWPRLARFLVGTLGRGSVSTHLAGSVSTRILSRMVSGLRGTHAGVCCERRTAARMRRDNAGHPGCRQQRGKAARGKQARCAREWFGGRAHPRLTGYYEKIRVARSRRQSAPRRTTCARAWCDTGVRRAWPVPATVMLARTPSAWSAN
jgi:hypothetical protein